MAPRKETVAKVAQLFGIWPKDGGSETALKFWTENWPSWYSGEASEQFKKNYSRPRNGDGKCDSLDKFVEAYCAALRAYLEDPESSPLHFSFIRDYGRLRELARVDLADLLRKAPPVLTHLKCQRSLCKLPLIDPVEDSIDAAAEWLLDVDIDDLITGCQGALRSLERRSPKNGTVPARNVLEELVQRVVPAVYKHYAVAKIQSALDVEIGGLVELPVHHPTVVDILVAAAEGRSTSYLPRKKREEWPAGAASFADQAPDNGPNGRENRAQDLRIELSKRFTAASADEVYNAVKTYVTGGAFYEFDPRTEFGEDEKFRIVGKVIHNIMRFQGRKFYMMFHWPKNKDDQDALKELVRKLGRNFRACCS